MREEQRFQPSYAFRTTGGVGNPTLLHNGFCPDGEGKQQQQQQFRDQLATVAGWFQRWNQCERTVALYSLLKQVPACQARFLAAVLEQSLASAGEVHRRAEEEANSPAFLSMLGSQPMEQVVETLLGRLPLLRPGNEAARRQYLGLLPRILAHSVARGSHVEEARQLLSYSLIHPALGAEDRRGLAGWLGCLEDRISFHQPEPPQSTGWPPDPCPVSPQGSLGDVSPPEPAAPTFQPNGPAMKDVPGWLKSLRLHKYANLFSNMTYEDMMALTEEQLETKGVTKGARHKIVLSIQKLKSRQTLLQNLEKEVQESPTSVRQVLSELKSLLQGPIQADSSPDGLTNLFTRVMGKICSTLLVTPHPEEDNLNLFLLLIEKCLSHEAFGPTHKRRLFSWKQQIQKIWHPLPARRTLARGWSHHQPHPQPHPQDGSLLHPTTPPLASVIKRPSLQDHHKPHILIQRTNSAPVRPLIWLPPEGGGGGDTDLTTRLENLCLSVTEHALADGGCPE